MRVIERNVTDVKSDDARGGNKLVIILRGALTTSPGELEGSVLPPIQANSSSAAPDRLTSSLAGWIPRRRPSTSSMPETSKLHYPASSGPAAKLLRIELLSEVSSIAFSSEWSHEMKRDEAAAFTR